ncbi:MAG TPA: sulfatase-like hydrolase/transferase [Humisphaera sp.]
MLKTALCALLFVVGGVMAAPALAAPPAAKPNIIFFLADDLGIDGVGCYGANAHKTPNIDALAASGTRFTTAYSAPLCGPSRCLLMTGRYAFRTGGLTNQSWRNGGPGAKSADEQPMARLLKQGGYATCQAGKWRQVGEQPSDWGFDEFLTDPTASGWYWETRYNKNGKELVLPEGAYGPDVVRDFALDFIRRKKDGPFFLYYASHLVHKPTLKTPDTVAGRGADQTMYEQNIRYMDKELGTLVAELEKLGIRQNTLIVFAGDNGTAAGYPSPVKGRMVNGAKGSMLEGGSRVPFVASWPGVTPAGKVCDDLVDFSDPHATFAEIAGVKPKDGFKTDGHSFLPQLRGEAGTPRKWAYVQLGARWFVREPGFKMNERGELFDMADAPFVEKPVAADADTDASKAARQRLSAALAELNPAGGKTDAGGAAAKPRKRNQPADPVKPGTPAGPATKPAVAAGAAGPWKSGDSLSADQAPDIANKPIEISAEIETAGEKGGDDGVIVTQGGARAGYAVYLTKGKLAFAVRRQKDLTTITAREPLGQGHFKVQATLGADGAMTLSVDGKPVAEGKAGGLLAAQPRAGLQVGSSLKAAVGEYEPPNAFKGKVLEVRVKTGK